MKEDISEVRMAFASCSQHGFERDVRDRKRRRSFMEYMPIQQEVCDRVSAASQDLGAGIGEYDRCEVAERLSFQVESSKIDSG